MIRRLLAKESTSQIARLATIGALNTVNYFIMLNVLRSAGVSLFVAVTVAFAVATFISYVLNRRWTFGLDESSGGAGETLRFYLVNVAAWAMTVAVIWLADQLFGPMNRLGENLASVVASALILVPKFLSYRQLVFGKAIAAARKTVRA